MRKTRLAVLAWQSAAVVALLGCFILVKNDILVFRKVFSFCRFLGIGVRRRSPQAVGCVLCKGVLCVSLCDSAHRKVTRTHTGGKRNTEWRKTFMNLWFEGNVKVETRKMS